MPPQHSPPQRALDVGRESTRSGRVAVLVGVCARPAPLAAGLVRWLTSPPLCARVAEVTEEDAGGLIALRPRLVVATEDVALRTVLPALEAAARTTTGVVVLTGGLTPRREAALLAAGALGAVDADAGRAAVVRMVADALQDRPVASPAAVRILAAGAGRGELTVRQRQILALLAEGRSTAEIASELCISATTVKTHVARLGSRFDIPGRRALVAMAPAILGEPLDSQPRAVEVVGTASAGRGARPPGPRWIPSC